ncbi:hypothetical protein SO802_005356 [Lithocarpus litseifolius]|uniref:Malectin-like domain-containing protein n=1 Tax=Lithocarpus litseifolius TaxID=425828 RepID=A0AAW2DHX6_9ROSI
MAAWISDPRSRLEDGVRSDRRSRLGDPSLHLRSDRTPSPSRDLGDGGLEIQASISDPIGDGGLELQASISDLRSEIEARRSNPWNSDRRPCWCWVRTSRAGSESEGLRSESAGCKDDVYDRLWFCSDTLIDNSVSINTSAVIDMRNNDGYKLPAEVLRTAVQASGAYNTLSFSLSGNSYSRRYVCFHFAEIAELTQGKKREFIISVNEENYTSKPITLEYLTPLSVCPNRTFESPLSISIDATMESDFPPILNAFEHYIVVPLPYKPTDHGDVLILVSNIKEEEIFMSDGRPIT